MDILVSKFESSSVATHDNAATEARVGHDDERAQETPLLPIFRLPPEILETILISCADDYHHSNFHYLDSRRSRLLPPRWVNVSYVCRHWRNVALNCTTLWAYHFVVSLRWTETLLARSKQAPLKIYIVFSHPLSTFWFMLVDKLMVHSKRIQALYLEHCNEEIFARLPPHAPCLETLHISFTIASSPESPVFCHRDTPVLRTLQLSHSPMPWYSFGVSRLTTLHLHYDHDHIRQDVAHFLTRLSRVPDLVHLSLDSVLVDVMTGHHSGDLSRKIHLPRLSRLSIANESLETVVALLSCLIIPPTAHVWLEFNENDLRSRVENRALLVSLPARRCSMSESPTTVRSLTIDLDTWTGRPLVFQFGESERCPSDAAERDDHGRCAGGDANVLLSLSVRLGGSQKTADRDRLISDVCRAVPLPDVHHLHVIDPPFSPAFWRATLGHLDGVQHVTLSDGNMPDLASVLQDGTVAPRLDKVALQRIAFEPEENGDTVDVRDPAISRRCLLDALLARGMSPDQLVMTDCSSSGLDRFEWIGFW